MRKYRTLFTLTWSNQLVYRFNVFFWRFRQFLGTVLALTVWQTIYQTTGSFQGYDRDTMIAYVFLTNILQSILLATSLHGLANHIWSGELTNQLVKPVSLYLYFGIQDIADKLRNTVFVLLESGVLYWIFSPSLTLPSPSVVVLVLLWSLFGALLYFWINLLFGALGFYSPQTWGPKFLFFVLLDFSAGKLFPLDILPDFLQSALLWTPFPYLGYVQTQLFLGRYSEAQILSTSLTLIFLVIATTALTLRIWSRSLREYAAVGQ